MAINKAAADQLTAHVRRKWNQGCPMCGSRDWELAGFLNLSITEDLNPASVVLGGPTLPSCAVVCRNCGNTVTVNLIVAGLVQKDG